MNNLTSHSPLSAGISLKIPHQQEILTTRPTIAWLEVHSENYFAEGGYMLNTLTALRSHYPISLHGVGLSLGSTDALNIIHLTRLKNLINRINPLFISEHMSWSSVNNRYLNDLLPLPYTEEALQYLVTRIQQVQDHLGREILIENISTYLQYTHSTITEWEFLIAIAQKSGCKILLDVNNIYVNACNHAFSAEDYLTAIPGKFVQEIHLAGFTRKQCGMEEILIDTHSKPVADAVWQLYQQAIRLFGRKPTLIEWDTDIPPLTILIEESKKANKILEQAING